MNGKAFLQIVLIINITIFGGCASSLKYTSKGFSDLSNINYGIARLKFEKALEKDSSNFEAYWGLAKYYYALDNYDKAQEYASSARDHGKKETSAFLSDTYVAIADSLFHSGNLREAEQFCNQALATNPTNINAKNVRAKIYYEFATDLLDRENMEAALDYYNKAIEDNPEHRAARIERSHIFLNLAGIKKINGEYSLALDYLNKAEKDNPQLKATTNFHKSQINEFKKKTRRAIKAATQAYESPLYKYDAGYKLATYYTAENEYQKAIDHLSNFYHYHHHIYHYYREKSRHDPIFHKLSHNDRFNRWQSGIRRLMIRVASVHNLSPTDPKIPIPFLDKLELPDTYFQIEYKDSTLFYSKICFDNSNPSWNENFAVFDYSFDDDIKIKFHDFDISVTEIITGCDLLSFLSNHDDLIHTIIIDTLTNEPNYTELFNGSSKVVVKLEDIDCHLSPTVLINYSERHKEILHAFCSCAANSAYNEVISVRRDIRNICALASLFKELIYGNRIHEFEQFISATDTEKVRHSREMGPGSCSRFD